MTAPAVGTPAPTRSGARRGVGTAVVLVAVLLVWEAAARALSGAYVLAAPSEIAVTMWTDADLLWRALLTTGRAALIGFVLGNLAAVLLATLAVLAPFTERVITVVALVVFCLPLVATGPVLRVVFGPGDGPQIVLAALAVYYTTMIPLLALGVPGDVITGVMLGAFMIQGLTPGPLLFQTNIHEVYMLLIGMLVSSVLLFFAGKATMRMFAKVSHIPQTLLTPLVLLLCIFGIYSIASSPKAHPDEVHLTIAVVRYRSHGSNREGVCSTYTADRVSEGETMPVYVHFSRTFKLPEDGDTPIIMVGPGTGIAPFRAFVEERAAIGATGKSWLFFGDQHRATDYLYGDEWERCLTEGRLSRIELAFSRDQAEKVYVQHLMLEQSAELYSWLSDGAVFYVCGDASRMAKDVHEALISIAEKEGGKSREDAEAWVKQLKADKQYLRDVY